MNFTSNLELRAICARQCYTWIEFYSYNISCFACFTSWALDLNPLSLVFCVESNPHVDDSVYCYDYFACHTYTKLSYWIDPFHTKKWKNSKNLQLFPISMAILCKQIQICLFWNFSLCSAGVLQLQRYNISLSHRSSSSLQPPTR